MLKYRFLSFFYKNIVKPLCFAVEAETAHNRITNVGEIMGGNKLTLGILHAFFGYERGKLEKEVLGLKFANPVGLAAGFDYDGHLAATLSSVGFGFNTVGTVTAQPYEGNSGPRMARLIKSESLLINKGFKSAGADAVKKLLDKKNLKNVTLGISVGSSNIPEVDTLEKAINDYLYTFNTFKVCDYVKYFELNISCPNTKMSESFTEPANFEKLCSAVQGLGLNVPVFVKMPSEISFENSDALVDIALKHGIIGFIFSNLVKDRNNLHLLPEELAQVKDLKGNFSGKPAKANSLNLVKHTREKYGNKIAIIGCGGIFSAKDAMERIDAGADLVQLITGMIFEGPQLMGEINEGLSKNKKSV